MLLPALACGGVRTATTEVLATLSSLNEWHRCRCSFLGVTQLQSRVALIMKYYPLGSLAHHLERSGGCGLQMEEALGWVGAWEMRRWPAST